MAKQGSLSFVELHLEKGVLGLAALFLIGAAAYYLVMEPNTIDYNGQQLGPSELDAAVLSQAEQLQRAVRNAEPESEPVPEYAQRLARDFQQGIFDDSLPQELRVVAQFNPPLPDFGGPAGEENIQRLVRPLPPKALAARTGISLAYEQPIELNWGELRTDSPDVEMDEPPKELCWVTVGAYFPMDAQQREMTNAQYAGHRAKVYFVGTEVQRQEILPSGDYSEWKTVTPGKAMPDIEPPEPVYDQTTGQLLNKDQIDAWLSFIRAEQVRLIQPDFYEIDAGTQWDIPPLPGYDFEEEEIEEDEPAARPKPRDRGRDNRRRSFPGGPPGAPPAGIPGGAPGGPPGAPGGAPPSRGEPRRNVRREINDKLKDAQRALRDKDYNTAQRLARDVVDESEASSSQVRRAERILDQAQKKLQQQSASAQPQQRATTSGVIFNPEREDEPAIWFHDDTVEPGKTYRYRMRVKLWNTYVGRKSALANDEDAMKTVIDGEWSLPSMPVTVARKRHFFVRGPKWGEPAATMEVFTWHKGNWLRETFDVRVGDTIGGPAEVKAGDFDEDGDPIRETVDFSTGAVVLDLRLDEPVSYRRSVGDEGEFAYRDTESVVLVYLDPADGQVKERISVVDRGDPDYKRLKEEWEMFRDSL